MKRYRLSIALTTGLVAVLAILAASMFGGAPTRAEDTAPLFPEPAYTPTPALAQPPARPALEGVSEPKSASVLFSDSFDGAKAAAAWKFADLQEVLPDEQAAWAVRDGALAQDGLAVGGGTSSNETAAYIGDGSWTDYSVSAKFYDRENGVFGLVARSSGTSFYRYTIIADRFQDTPKQLLEKVVDGVATPLAAVETGGFQSHRWYNVTMSVVGSDIRVWLDGKLVLQASDSELKSGQAGLYTRALGEILFDDVVVAKP